MTEEFGLSPAVCWVREAEGLKLAPPNMLPIKLHVMTRIVLKIVEMKSDASGIDSIPRDVDVKIVRSLRNEPMDIHMIVSIASAMAIFSIVEVMIR